MIASEHDRPDDIEIEGDIDLLLATVEPTAPSSSLRDLLLGAVNSGHWYEPFVRRAASILELPLVAARAVLQTIDSVDGWMMGPADGIELLYIKAGPDLATAITGFVRLAPGAAFPSHRHVGHEDVLVLQGSFAHDGVVVVAGQEAPMSPSSSHHVVAGPQGCLYLAVVLEGLAFEGEEPIGADDLRA